MPSAGEVAFSVAFEISPIILTGGIATAIGGALPIVALTGGLASLIPTSFNPLTSLQDSLDNAFAKYTIIPGGSLIRNNIGMYPFPNQVIAANAIIAQPLNVSVRMVVPARTPVTAAGTPSLPIVGTPTVPLTGGYAARLATMTALQASLAQHNNLGGLYSILTPAFPYTNGIMVNMSDATNRGPSLTQSEWQLDFQFPLVTTQAANNSLNGLMQKLSDGTAISGTPSWAPPGLALGNLGSLLSSSLVPSSLQ